MEKLMDPRKLKQEKMSERASTGRDDGSLISQFIKKSASYDSYSNSDHRAKKNKSQNSNNTKSCEVISNPLLLEDLRFHIFTFVSLNCLLNSVRYVCKSWANTIASSHFAQACERREHSRFGLYVESRRRACANSYFLEFKDYNYENGGGLFERTNLRIPHEMGYLISTCDGMLLMRNSLVEKILFFVNPFLKCWLRLPYFPFSQRNPISFQCIIGRVPGTAKFKLFFTDSVEVSGVYWCILYVLRIGSIDNSWKEIIRKKAPLQRHFACRLFYNGGNDLYWKTENAVFVIDVVKEIILRECTLPYMSNVVSRNYLLTRGQFFYIAPDYALKTFKIYILDFDSGKLSLYHEMGPFDFLGTCGREAYFPNLIFCFWINNQIIFKVTLQPLHLFENMHFGYNVKTRQLTKIEGIDVGDLEVWPHTNSLISLPNTPI